VDIVTPGASSAVHGDEHDFGGNDNWGYLDSGGDLDSGVDIHAVSNHRSRILDLHFDAVISSCDQLSTATTTAQRCNEVVSQSAKSIFSQLHIKARMDEASAPLSKEEVTQFQSRFEELVIGESKKVISPKTSVTERYHGWKNLVHKGYWSERPAVPKALVDYVNLHSAALGWAAEHEDVFPAVSAKKAEQKLGFVMAPEEEAEMKNDTEMRATQDLLEIGNLEFPAEYDVREAYPECKEVTGHVRFQTCNNCWSHSTALITESRLCIKSRGEFNGKNAWLSQSYIAQCRTDGQDYCDGGSGLLGFKTVNRWGVPTGGPDARGNMEDDVQTCYPQTLPNEDGVQCPGACSPYVKYPRPLNEDLFYVKYQPRALHPSGSQTIFLAKQSLLQDGPILLGMRIYQDFYSYKSGIYKPALTSWNRYMGGHAVTGMGFGPDHFLCINSWSKAWGIEGAFKVAPSAVDFGYFLPGHPLGGHTSRTAFPKLFPTVDAGVSDDS